MAYSSKPPRPEAGFSFPSGPPDGAIVIDMTMAMRKSMMAAECLAGLSCCAVYARTGRIDFTSRFSDSGAVEFMLWKLTATLDDGFEVVVQNEDPVGLMHEVQDALVQAVHTRGLCKDQDCDFLTDKHTPA